MYDEHIKSRLIKDIRFFREIKDQNDHKVFYMFFWKGGLIQLLNILTYLTLLCFTSLGFLGGVFFNKLKVCGKPAFSDDGYLF